MNLSLTLIFILSKQSRIFARISQLISQFILFKWEEKELTGFNDYTRSVILCGLHDEGKLTLKILWAKENTVFSVVWTHCMLSSFEDL